DRDTSGCLVLGRHRKALAALGRLFKSGQVGKTYWAVVAGGPPQYQGRIELPLGRKDATRGWWMKHDPSGQPAATTSKVRGRTRLPPAGGPERHHVACLALEPLTGRTHQLRVHCAAMGWPIIGDSVYGSAPRTGAPGLNLHAREVVVPARADPRRRAGAAAHATTAARMRMAGRRARPLIAMSRRQGARYAQYSVAFKHSGAARSWASPPSFPSVNSARIVPLLGRLWRFTWRDGSHSFERTTAFEH